MYREQYREYSYCYSGVKGWTILVAVDQSAEYYRTQQDLEHAKVILPHENVC